MGLTRAPRTRAKRVIFFLIDELPVGLVLVTCVDGWTTASAVRQTEPAATGNGHKYSLN